MNFLDRLNIYTYHNDRYKKWPNNAQKVLGWKSEESQLSRFRILADQHDFNRKSILDLGCGYGDLKPFLDKHYDIAHYTGVDQLKLFVNSAKKRKLKNSHFIHADFSRQAFSVHDIVVASGSLNYHSSTPDYLNKMICKMYTLANEAVILNLLNATNFPSCTLLKSYYPEDVLQYCKGLTENCYIAKQPITDNFTVVLKK